MNYMSTKVKTGTCRLSYVHLLEPHENLSGKMKYSVTLLIPKEDKQTLEDLQKAFAEAVENGVSDKWGGKKPPKMDESFPWYDGDGCKPKSGDQYGDECKGCFVMAATTDFAPEIVEKKLSDDNQRVIFVDLDSDEQVYSGMFGKVSVNLFPFLNKGNKGVGVGLNSVLKVKDGESLSQRVSAAQEFADD